MAATPKQEIMKWTTLFGKVLIVWALLSCQAGFAQTSTSPAAGLQNGPNEKALRNYYAAFMKNDWSIIQPVLADGFTFSSPIDDHIQLSTFKARCWPNAKNTKRFDLVKVVMNGDEAFVIYNGYTTSGKLFRNSDYFTFKNGKIVSYECFFGPGVNFPNSSKK
jgi:ketosteroid isomerase-like protein